MDWAVTIDGQSPTDARQNPLVNLEAVSSGYFETMEIPIIDGRTIGDADREGRPAAAVVSQSFARRFWPDGEALGRRLTFPLPGSPFDRQWFTVVGIVGDAKYRELRGSRLDLYISSAQCPYPVHQFVVRTASGRPDSIVGAVRSEVRALDPALPIDDVVVLRDAVQSQIANPRLVALTLNGFATTASALAALGLGTLIAWQVRLRTREIGVRLALGATPRQVIGIVMGESIPVVAVGVGAGLAAALLLGGLLGVAAGALLSWLLYRGLLAIPLKRLFSVTGWLIALLAAGMAGQAAAILAGADLIPAWGFQLWDTSWLLPSDGIVGRALRALVGYSDRPMGVQLAAWALTFAALVFATRCVQTRPSAGRSPGGRMQPS